MIEFHWTDESKSKVVTEVSNDLYEALKKAASEHGTTLEKTVAVFLDAAAREYFNKTETRHTEVLIEPTIIRFPEVREGEVDVTQTSGFATMLSPIPKRGRPAKEISTRKFAIEKKSELDERLDTIQYVKCASRNCISGGKYVKGTEFWEPLSGQKFCKRQCFLFEEETKKANELVIE